MKLTKPIIITVTSTNYPGIQNTTMADKNGRLLIELLSVKVHMVYIEILLASTAARGEDVILVSISINNAIFRAMLGVLTAAS